MTEFENYISQFEPSVQKRLKELRRLFLNTLSHTEIG